MIMLCWSQMLERKLFKAQEELTDLLKTRSNNAQLVIQLTATVQERDADIRRKEAELDAKNVVIERLRAEAESNRESLAQLEAANSVLQDEYNSLHMAFTRTEENFRKLDAEHSELIQRWMQLKARDADKMNEENEQACPLTY